MPTRALTAAAVQRIKPPASGQVDVFARRIGDGPRFYAWPVGLTVVCPLFFPILIFSYSAGHSTTNDPYEIYSVWEGRGKYRDIASVFRGRVIAYMAGFEAEVEIMGHSRGGDGDDRKQIEYMLGEFIFDEGAEEYERRLRLKTRNLVRRHRLKIERVAELLLEYGSLSARDVDRLIKSATTPEESQIAKRIYLSKERAGMRAIWA